MKYFFIKVLFIYSIIFFLLDGPRVEAQTRSQIDREIKVVASTSKDFVNKLRDIAFNTDGDSIADYDRAEETALYLENKLAEAYAALFYHANTASSITKQKKIVERIDKRLSKEQRNQFREILNQVQKFAPDERGELQAQEFILEQSAHLAKKEIHSARKSFEKQFKTILTEKSRELSKEQNEGV